ncbi:MAG: MBL fold metallo-hydrolase [Nitriliruptorales bacterium]|nr:MBL fold metallo-hydrolase [Nitriliruptorales bacterium]
MRVHLLGVRGSTPAPGAAFVRYGGHTSCVAIEHGGVIDLVLDAGTGLRTLGALLDGRPFEGTILLSHLHWDHLQGLPFSPAVDDPEAAVDLYLPVEEGDDPEAVLARAMSPPHFPIPPSGLQGRWRFQRLVAGELEVPGYHVVVRDVPHKGGRTVGIRVERDGASLVYVPDHAPSAVGPGRRGDGVLHDAITDLVEGTDLLLHDSQHTLDEFPARAHFGHTTIDYSRELAAAGNVGHLVLFHHDPNRVDGDLEQLEDDIQGWEVPTTVAREGMTIDVPVQDPGA